MASALSHSVRRLRYIASAAAGPSRASTSYATSRSLSASVRRFDDEKPKPPSSSDEASSSTSSGGSSTAANDVKQDASYKPPASANQRWPFDSAASSGNGGSAPSTPSKPSSSSSSSSDNNPYKGLFDGSDPFPTVTPPRLGTNTSSLDHSSSSDKASWLSDQLDSLTTSPRTPRSTNRPTPSSPDERKKHLIPRSVLFADSESTRQSDDFKPRKTSPSAARKRFDRTPLTQQEANAFMSLLNQALAGTSSSSSASPSSTSPLGSSSTSNDHTPFGSYTSLISNPKTQSGSRALLQAFAKRNRLKRFEDARAQRAKRFVREGLAAQIDPLQLEAGIDEAREALGTCENLAQVLEWTKREVWGITPPATPNSESDSQSLASPKYGKDTAFYASVLHLVFLAIRDRYRSPRVALSITRTTRSLGIESYVLGMTGSLYNEVLKTQWDWLGDLPGVVSTLRQARETGILSAPVKTSAAPRTEEGGVKVGYATSEDETIRETVDRIANDVRKYVLDQQLSMGGEDVLAGRGAERSRDWSQKWLLENAEEATNLAGQPFRTMYKHRARFERDEEHEQGRNDRAAGGMGRFSGGGERRSFRGDGGRFSSESTFGSRSGGFKARGFDQV
ncbi:Mtf2 domain-containing protein [Pseudozyma hubeiensis]|nr:Mtf2 domain-containing protein [Pseudozyma hubeiensis]